MSVSGLGERSEASPPWPQPPPRCPSRARLPAGSFSSSTGHCTPILTWIAGSIDSLERKRERQPRVARTGAARRGASHLRTTTIGLSVLVMMLSPFHIISAVEMTVANLSAWLRYCTVGPVSDEARDVAHEERERSSRAAHLADGSLQSPGRTWCYAWLVRDGRLGGCKRRRGDLAATAILRVCAADQT